MLETADYDMTEMAMERDARYAGDKNLWVQFHVLPMMDDQASSEAGRPIYKDVEHVRILTPGNKESIVDRPVTRMDIARFRNQYENWKANETELIEGTLLETVARDPMLRFSPSQIEEMKYFNIRTLEQLANISDTHAQKFMGINMMRSKARDYLEQAKERAVTTRLNAELEQRDNKIASLEQALESLQDQLRSLTETKRNSRRAASSN